MLLYHSYIKSVYFIDLFHIKWYNYIEEVTEVLRLKLISAENVCKFTVCGTEINTVYNEKYEPGDTWHIETDGAMFVKVKLDETMLDSILYLPEKFFEFEIPFGNERICCYAPEAFSGESHRIICAIPTDAEIYGEREISLNPHDRHNVDKYYPHAWANAVTKEHPSLFERNAIDGVIRNEHHGRYPHHSWGGGAREDLEYEVRFGIEAEVSRITIFIRADFPHDTYWREADLEFSDGTVKHITLAKTVEGQVFEFEPIKSNYVRLCGFKQQRLEDGSLSFAALSQIQIYGKYIK